MSVYFNLPGTGIAILGAILAIVLTQIKRSQTMQTAVAQGGYTDDDEDF